MELFGLIADGDEVAFRTLFRQYSLQLRPFIYNISHSDELTDEVIQETMIKVWINRDRLGDIEHPRAWVYRIAANLCYNHRKKLLADKKVIARSISAGHHNEVIESVDYGQLKADVREGIALLPDKRREIYLLRRDQGMTIPEIAKQLNLSTNTVRNTLATATEFIRDYLQKKGYSTTLLLASVIYHI